MTKQFLDHKNEVKDKEYMTDGKALNIAYFTRNTRYDPSSRSSTF